MDSENSAHDLDPILRSELSILEVSLKNGSIEEKRQAFDRLCELGQTARPLVPVILSMVDQRSSWLRPSMLIKLLKVTKDVIIVQALQKANLLQGLSILDQADCFRYGAKELEDELLSYIWQHRDAPGNPARPEVVKALSEKGGLEALKMMKALLVELSESNELEPTNVLAAFENAAQIGLREEVRKSIRQLNERGIR